MPPVRTWASVENFSMRKLLLTTLMLLAMLASPAGVFAQTAEDIQNFVQGDSQADAPPATQPTTQTVVVVPIDENSKSVFGNTDLGKLVRGEKQLTLDEAMGPGFWVTMLQDVIAATLAFLPRLIVAIMLFCVFWLIYRAARKIVTGSMARANVDESIRDMLSHLIKWSILGFGLVIACNQIGIQIAALLTGVSIIGLAIGFAAQESLANFIAGIVIFWDRPFRVGDWITCDETFGQVQRVTFRSTRIVNTDGEMVIWPNTHMLQNKVKNHTVNPLNRVNVPVSIAYKESIDAARGALLEVVNRDARILQSPAPEVVVAECAPSSVNLVLRFWISDESIERRITYEYNETAKKALDAAGIEIPFPHVQLMLEQTPALKALLGDDHGEAKNRGNG